MCPIFCWDTYFLLGYEDLIFCKGYSELIFSNECGNDKIAFIVFNTCLFYSALSNFFFFFP